jgi:hypothetical protein
MKGDNTFIFVHKDTGLTFLSDQPATYRGRKMVGVQFGRTYVFDDEPFYKQFREKGEKGVDLGRTPESLAPSFFRSLVSSKGQRPAYYAQVGSFRWSEALAR